VQTDGPATQASTPSTHQVLELLYRRDVALAHLRSVLTRKLGVTETEVLALIHLHHRGEMSPSGVAELLDLSSGGATALVQRLVARGHVTRHPHPTDRRSTLLRVTPGTADTLTSADESLHAGLDALTAGLGGEQQATVAAFLTELAELFEEAAAERGDRAQATDALERPVPSLWG
jgi:DNA-binding MarR family transcriptional regulator